MNTNEYKIEWCLTWSEDERGWPVSYYVSDHQQRERRELNDGTGDVLYRLRLNHKTGKGWYLSFGIDYIPNHYRVTKWHESVADCWHEMLTLGVSETTMKIIENDISGSDINADCAPRMLEYFRELCSAQGQKPRRAGSLTKPKRRIRPASAEGRQPRTDEASYNENPNKQEEEVMTIGEIQSIDENQVKAMSKEAIKIKGHTVYLVDLGGYFGYSALVFSEGRHIYHANDYALHHADMKDDAKYLRNWYVKTMNCKLFTEDELRTPSGDYSEREAKECYLHNYYPMKREYQTMFCSFDKAAEWYRRDKESAIFSPIAFAYFKPCDAAFVAHLDELYKAFRGLQQSLRDYEHAKDAFEHEMWNHEYAINLQGDYDVISCFANVSYKGDGTELDQTGWTEEIKRAYHDAANHVLKKSNH